MCFDFFEFPQHKSFRGVKEFQETTKEVLELEERAAAVKSSKKKGKLNAAMKRKQAQLTGALPAPRAAAPAQPRGRYQPDSPSSMGQTARPFKRVLPRERIFLSRILATLALCLSAAPGRPCMR